MSSSRMMKIAPLTIPQALPRANFDADLIAFRPRPQASKTLDFLKMLVRSVSGRIPAPLTGAHRIGFPLAVSSERKERLTSSVMMIDRHSRR